MGEFLISIDGKYTITENTVYSAVEGKSYDVYDFGFDKWIDVLEENTIYSIRNNINTLTELASYQRRVTYQLMSDLNETLKSKLMLEYEGKFGNLLLTENVVLLEGWFKDAWKWTKDKVVGAGEWLWGKLKEFGEFAVKTGKDFMTCITGKGCSLFFEDYREMLFSPVGIAVETFLTMTVVGDIGPIVAWGILALWDGYLLFSGSPDFQAWNLFFDILGMLFAPLVKGLKSFIGLFKGAKSLEGVVEIGLKNPETKGMFRTIVDGLKSGFNSMVGTLKKAASVMSEKMGLKWVGSALESFTNYVAKFLDKIGVKSTEKNIARAGGSNVVSLSKGLKTASKVGLVNQGFQSGVEWGGNKIEAHTNAKNVETYKPMFDNDMNNLYKEMSAPVSPVSNVKPAY